MLINKGITSYLTKQVNILFNTIKLQFVFMKCREKYVQIGYSNTDYLCMYVCKVSLSVYVLYMTVYM